MNQNALSTTPTAGPRRRRRWPRYLFAALFIFGGIPTLLYQYLKWSSVNDAAALMAEIERSDPNWRLDDLEASRETLADDENSALFVVKVVGMGGPSGTHRREFYEQFENFEPQHEMNAVQMELLQDAYAKIQDVLVEARKLKDMPKGRFPIRYSDDFISTTLTHQQNARRIFEILQHDVWMRAQSGDLDGAVESCRAALNAARSLGDEPLLISFLIRVAGDHIAIAGIERTLAQGRPSEQALASLQKLIEEEIVDVEKHWRNALRGERGGHERLIQAISSGKIRVSHVFGGWRSGPGSGPASFGEGLADHFPVILTRETPELLRYMNRAVEITTLPHEEQIDKLDELGRSIPKHSYLVRMLAPALHKVGYAHLRSHAMLGATQVSIAAERYRLRHQRWPESIKEMVNAGFISAIPKDPFDGAPLRWRRTKEGWAAYSVANDKTDDRGNINNGRSFEPGFDLGFRLWDLERRRQTPRPPVAIDELQPRP